LSQAQRTTILELHSQGVAKREIARVLGISRVAVRRVLRSNSTAVPELPRPEKAEPYRQQILDLFDQSKGNLVRVHEELQARGAQLSYAALTPFCRRHGIGYRPPVAAGQYDGAGSVSSRILPPVPWIAQKKNFAGELDNAPSLCWWQWRRSLY